MKNSFFKTNTVMISSRMNEYLKNNFGYEIEGDLASLREAKASLEAQKRELSADYQNRDYVENMLMLETIKSLLKVHNEHLGEGYGKKKMKEAGKPDFLDLDKDGNKKEPMKKAAKDAKKKVAEAANRYVDIMGGDLPNGIDYDFNNLPKVNWSQYSREEIAQFVDSLHNLDFEDEDGNGGAGRAARWVEKNVLAKKKVAEAAERPYVCVHAKKGKHSCTAGSSYEAAKKAAKAWGLKSTAGIDAHLADVKHTATESVQPKVDTNKKNYENSYKAPKEYKMKKTKLEEGLLAQLNALLEGDAAEAEITMAARGIVDELQDIIEKLGKIQNDQLGPLADEMSYTHGPEQADAFKASTDAAISTLLDTARQTKDEVNNAVLVLNGQAPATDMTAGEPELGGDMGDDFESDIEVDAMGGDEATSGPVDEPLGRAKR